MGFKYRRNTMDKNIIIGNYSIYNGVNHDIVLYKDGYKANRNRNKKYFIEDFGTSKEENIKYKQSIPLSVYENKKEAVLGSELSSIKFNDQIIEILNNYYDYDMIIVSKRYADKACELLSGDAKYHDYLDRLYMPVKAYDHDASKVKNVKVIGCVDFKKVWYHDNLFLLSTYYESVNAIRDGRFENCKLKNIPSKKAVYDSLRRYLTMRDDKNPLLKIRACDFLNILKEYWKIEI